ncbi:MAG: hypothetical protein WAQ05_03310 [Rubrivivax sp.]
MFSGDQPGLPGFDGNRETLLSTAFVPRQAPLHDRSPVGYTLLLAIVLDDLVAHRVVHTTATLRCQHGQSRLRLFEHAAA